MTFEGRSTKIFLSQRALSQRKRRTVTAIATARPCHGRSASLRSYRLWTRCDRRWQTGHQADASLGSACIVIRPSSVKIRLTINSEGTSASIASKFDDPSVSHLSPRFAYPSTSATCTVIAEEPFFHAEAHREWTEGNSKLFSHLVLVLLGDSRRPAFR